jgi:GNAT superfamily N-acetyltransferase
VPVEQTNDPVEALGWALELLGPGSPAAFLLAPARFLVAERTADSMALTLGGAECVGIGFGPHPPVRDEWRRYLVSGAAPLEAMGALTRRDGWDFYSRPVSPSEPDADVAVVTDEDAVTHLLRSSAPDLSVWPGNPEVVAWFGVDDERGLASAAALVRWESGHHVVSSVTTRTDARGRGLAERVVRGVVHAAATRHLTWLGLGVGRDNLTAQRIYERVGFTRRARFDVYVATDPDPDPAGR